MNDPATAANDDLRLLRHLQGGPAIADRHRRDAITDLVSAFDAAPTVDADCTLVIYAFYVQPAASAVRRLSWGDVDPSSEPWDEILRALSRSIAETNPRAVLVIATDHATALPELACPHRVVRMRLDPERLMYERQRAFAALLHSKLFSRPVVFLDTDVICLKDLAPVFDLDFDVAVTYRAATTTLFALMPANEGMIFASNRRSGATRRFFAELLAHYHALAEDPATEAWHPGGIWAWRGGQLALNSMAVGWKLIRDDRDVRFAERDATSVAFLPAHLYNRVAEPGRPLDEARADGAYAVHLKGKRKQPAAGALAGSGDGQ